MQLLNCGFQPIIAKLPGRKPTVMGAYEIVWPTRRLALPALRIDHPHVTPGMTPIGMLRKLRDVTSLKVVPQVIDATDKGPITETEGEAVLARWGRAGIVIVRAGYEPHDAMMEGLQKRHELLRAHITRYREDQYAQRAKGLEVRMLRQYDREVIAEMKLITRVLGEEDPALLEALGPMRPETVGDPLAAELAEVGITPIIAPLVPDMTGSGADLI